MLRGYKCNYSRGWYGVNDDGQIYELVSGLIVDALRDFSHKDTLIKHNNFVLWNVFSDNGVGECAPYFTKAERDLALKAIARKQKAKKAMGLGYYIDRATNRIFALRNFTKEAVFGAHTFSKEGIRLTRDEFVNLYQVAPSERVTYLNIIEETK